MAETYVARCFYCDWGITHELDVVREDSQAHVAKCPGPVLALFIGPRQCISGRAPLQFWSPKTRCGGCGMPTRLCICVLVDVD